MCCRTVNERQKPRYERETPLFSEDIGEIKYSFNNLMEVANSIVADYLEQHAAIYFCSNICYCGKLANFLNRDLGCLNSHRWWEIIVS